MILLGVGNATYDSRTTQYESLLNSHHLRSNGVDVQDIAKIHGGLQMLEIKQGDVKHQVPLDFDGDIMKLNLHRPTEEELSTMGVIWITPAMENSTPHPIRRSRVARPSYELQEVGNDILPEAEIPTNPQMDNTENVKDITSSKARNWTDFLGYPTEKVLNKTLEATTQFCAEPVEAEQREIPRQHRKKRLLPLHPRRLRGRVDSDTFFSSVPSIRGYKCVQFFVHVPSDFIFIRCMQRESHSHGAYQDFIREIGAPEMIVTDNSKTQTGSKWEATSRSIITKQRKFSPHNQNQNQNKAERRIQDAKHKTVQVMERTFAPISFWCYALIYIIDCLNHIAKQSLNWRTSYELLNGDTPDISSFRFSFWQEIEYFEPTARFPEARWKHGRFLGIAWDSGDAFTFKVWTEKDGDWSKGRELTRNVVRARKITSTKSSTRNDNLDDFYFKKKVYTKKRRGKHRDRVYTLVPLSDTSDLEAPSANPTDPFQLQSNPPSVKLDHDESVQEEPSPSVAKLNVGEEEENIPPVSTPVQKINDSHNTNEKTSNSINIESQSTPDDIGMVKEINNQFSNKKEDPSFGGSGVLGILAHDWRMGQLTLKVQWSSGDTTWEKFVDLKEDYPRKIAQYIVQNNVTRKKRGVDRTLQWAKKVVRDMDRAARRLTRIYNFSLDADDNIRYQRRATKKKRRPQYQKIIKYGIDVPRNVQEAFNLDSTNGDTYWQDAINLEMDSLNKMDCFQFKEKGFIPDVTYQRTTLHMVFDVKQDLRRKARLVAGGHLIDLIETPTYSSTVNSISVQLLHLIAHQHNLKQLCGDVGNAYVNAYTNEKVFAIAGPEFGKYEGCTVIIIKALYGLCSSSERWHSHFADSLRSFGFVPTRFDNDVWIRLHESKTSYEYVCTHSDDFMITSKNPEAIMAQIESVYSVKESSKGEPSYYLGHDYKKDSKGRWCIGCKKYLTEAIQRI